MESAVMQEIHRFQEKFYEETKDMTLQEFLEYVHKRAEKVRKELEEFKKKNEREILKQ
jgi:protein-disulfide isomerase-like protein with CxxC motif